MAKISKPKKTSKSSSKKSVGIKYSDKSINQPELVPIFNELVELLKPYERGSITIRGGSQGQISLVSEKEVLINGKKRDEMWFAAALVQKGYVGFYYMPVYGEPEMKKFFKPELLKCLKGKSCFHIKKYDKEIFNQIKEALKKGYKCYIEKEWAD